MRARSLLLRVSTAARRYGSAVDEFAFIDPLADDAQQAMAAYFAELDHRFAGGFDPGDALAAAGDAFRPPNGCFVIIRSADTAVAGCAGVQWLDDRTGEVKRMWISPDARGRGLGKRLLQHLEATIADSGRTRVLLDTNGTLAEAIAMYTSGGYREVPPYNDNPYAQHWFEKHLA